MKVTLFSLPLFVGPPEWTTPFAVPFTVYVKGRLCVACTSVFFFCFQCSLAVVFVCVLQVLCSNSVLDSSEYWLRNEKALCRLGLLDDNAEGSCTMVSSILQVKKRTHRCGSQARPSHFHLSSSCRIVCGPEQQQVNSLKFQEENDT